MRYNLIQSTIYIWHLVIKTEIAALTCHRAEKYELYNVCWNRIPHNVKNVSGWAMRWIAAAVPEPLRWLSVSVNESGWAVILSGERETAYDGDTYIYSVSGADAVG